MAADGPMDNEQVTYEILIKGHLDDRWAVWFGGLNIERDFSPDGAPVTRLLAPMPDQAALHGVIARIRDIGVPIISINPVAPGEIR